MKKKIISLVLTMVMLASLLVIPVSVSATESALVTGDGQGKWNRTQTPTGTVGTDYSVTISNTGGYNSDHALHVIWNPTASGAYVIQAILPTKTYNAGTANETVVTGGIFTTPGKYKYSMMVKKVAYNPTGSAVDSGFTTPWSWQGNQFQHQGLTTGEWKELSFTGDFSGSNAIKTAAFTFKGDDAQEYYIDNITLVRVDDNGNALTPNLLGDEQSTFETTPTVVPDPEPALQVGDGQGMWNRTTTPTGVEGTDYSVTISNTGGYNSDHALHVIWKPSASGAYVIQAILPNKTYNAGTANETVVTGGVFTTPGKYKYSMMVKKVAYNPTGSAVDSGFTTPWSWQGNQFQHQGLTTGEWKELSFTGDFSGSNAIKTAAFTFKGDDAQEYYIDNITLVRVDDNGNALTPNLLGDEQSTFEPTPAVEPEPEPEPDPEPALQVSDGEGKWNRTQTPTGTVGTDYSVTISNTGGYNSDHALHVIWNPTASGAYVIQAILPTKTYNAGTANETVVAGGVFTTPGKYKYSMRVKKVAYNPTGSAVDSGFTTPWSWQGNQFQHQGLTTGEWKELSFTGDFSGSNAIKTAAFTFKGDDAQEYYIDNITLVRVDDNGNALTPNLLGDEQSTFEPTPAVEPEPAVVYPDLTAETFGDAVWHVEQAPKDEATLYKREITAKEGYNSTRSLHFVFQKASGETQNLAYRLQLPDSSYTDPVSGITTTVSGTKIQEKGKYKVSFWVKVISGCENCGFAGPWSWAGNFFKDNGVTANGQWTYVEKIGDLTAEVTNGGAATRNMTFTVKGDGYNEMYLDNLSIVRVDDKGNEVSPNLVQGVAGTFETVTSGTEVFGANIYDDKWRELTHITADDSGKTVRAAATIISHEKDVSGQIFLSLYDGQQLKAVALSESVTAKKNQEIADLSAELKLPSFTDTENLKLKTFLWTGDGTIKPLSEVSMIDKNAPKQLELGNVVIFGDSISTFGGYIPDGHGASYNNYGSSCTNVVDVRETWWRQLIDLSPTNNLLLNSSWGGTTVCHTGYSGEDVSNKSFITRADGYINSGFFTDNQADTIFIFGGTNDAWAKSPVGELQYADWTQHDLYSSLPAYCYLLDRLSAASPESRIVCLMGIALSDALRDGYTAAAEHYGAEVVTLTDIDSFDGHPTVKGMTQIKEQAMKVLLDE